MAMAKLLINIDVDPSQIDDAATFYQRAFGLRVGRRFDGFVELLGAEAPIYLLAKKSSEAPFEGATTARDYGRHWTPVHLDFVVGDIESAIQRASDAGARVERSVSEHAYGRLALLSDPFGHGVCLLQFTGKGYDELLAPPPSSTSRP
jgi:predicted enzyme related to lactoylglutathione lyase